MVEARGTGRPWHLWVVGIAGGLWSVMGVVSFILTQMNVEAVMSGFPPQQRAYFESFPLWTDAFWAVSVFSSLVGCLLLLLKRRIAYPVLLAALIAAVVYSLGGLFLLNGMEVMRETGGLSLSLVPIIFAGVLTLYARAMSEKGVLG